MLLAVILFGCGEPREPNPFPAYPTVVHDGMYEGRYFAFTKDPPPTVFAFYDNAMQQEPHRHWVFQTFYPNGFNEGGVLLYRDGATGDIGLVVVVNINEGHLTKIGIRTEPFEGLKHEIENDPLRVHP